MDLDPRHSVPSTSLLGTLFLSVARSFTSSDSEIGPILPARSLAILGPGQSYLINERLVFRHWHLSHWPGSFDLKKTFPPSQHLNLSYGQILAKN